VSDVMKLVVVDECPSTFAEAEALLTAGHAAPFLVLAKRQTEGRGQKGRSWASPEGNLYLTMVLPSGTWARDQVSLIPLVIATFLGQWLRSVAAIRVTIKWPNDLLFAGKKLGGILCEVATQGEAWGPFLIGIGINLEVAPNLGPEAVQEAVSLRTITGRGGHDVVALAKGLIEDWGQFVAAGGLTFQQQAFDDYALEVGQVLAPQHRAGDAVAVKGLDASGALIVCDLAVDAPVPRRLTSARESWHWLYQKGEQPLVVADCGNTSLKVFGWGHAQGGSEPSLRLRSRYDAVKDLGPAIRDWLSQRLKGGPWPVHVGSVNPEGAARFMQVLKQAGLFPIPIPKRPVRVVQSDYALQDIGADRLALLEAAVSYLGEAPAIAVSLGTATTFDLLGPDARHLGGFIVAGLLTQLEALNERTGLLPRLGEQELAMVASAWHESWMPGHGTVEAMAGGVLLGLKGLIAELRAWLRPHYGGEAQLLLSGGLAPLVSPLLGATAAPDLVLEGYRIMALGGVLKPRLTPDL